MDDTHCFSHQEGILQDTNTAPQKSSPGSWIWGRRGSSRKGPIQFPFLEAHTSNGAHCCQGTWVAVQFMLTLACSALLQAVHTFLST